ncbi:radical SAM family heme chaperone HemW [Pedobacter sp. SYSU D00535]|uniref:radical SAM family heme chaperone HemW n=1 Tax=Pedobacter sp. SYSU D00535 TaxID=2810308 RepID=UPI001A95F8D5|nr:radical SAM family heme chaperone HemW [Pedobacter sp. SYSU D00535]
MAGIYLHIPFCKQACHYCDFHFTTSFKYKDELLRAMHKEMELQSNYLQGEEIQTVYFGGGTPSLIGASEIQKFIDQIAATFSLAANAEITLEANPDDLDAISVKALRETAINRFSIGIQSFYEEDLKWMNRAHNAVEAESAVKRVQDAGFENITVDLIYGYPLLSDKKWKSNIAKVIEFEVPHVSAYSMTVEQKTALAHSIRKGTQPGMNDTQSAEQFIILMEMLEEAGFEHYEISNFAKPGCYSKHNSNYWKGVSYLGLGPSAHSFNGESRQWNVANNSKYIEALQLGQLAAETEKLRTEDRVNEYIMTALRTAWGLNLNHLRSVYGSDVAAAIAGDAQEFIEKGWLQVSDEIITLTREGKLFADHIAAELFVDSEIG